MTFLNAGYKYNCIEVTYVTICQQLLKTNNFTFALTGLNGRLTGRCRCKLCQQALLWSHSYQPIEHVRLPIFVSRCQLGPHVTTNIAIFLMSLIFSWAPDILE